VLKSAAARLARARDAQGRKLDVIRLPIPPPIVFTGQRLPASYANFYIGNSAVLVPTFNDPKDREALGILAELFPVGAWSASTPRTSSSVSGPSTAARSRKSADFRDFQAAARQRG